MAKTVTPKLEALARAIYEAYPDTEDEVLYPGIAAPPPREIPWDDHRVNREFYIGIARDALRAIRGHLLPDELKADPVLGILTPYECGYNEGLRDVSALFSAILGEGDDA